MKKIIKKLFTFFCVIILIFSFSGCNAISPLSETELFKERQKGITTIDNRLNEIYSLNPSYSTFFIEYEANLAKEEINKTENKEEISIIVERALSKIQSLVLSDQDYLKIKEIFDSRNKSIEAKVKYYFGCYGGAFVAMIADDCRMIELPYEEVNEYTFHYSYEIISVYCDQKYYRLYQIANEKFSEEQLAQIHFYNEMLYEKVRLDEEKTSRIKSVERRFAEIKNTADYNRVIIVEYEVDKLKQLLNQATALTELYSIYLENMAKIDELLSYPSLDGITYYLGQYDDSHAVIMENGELAQNIVKVGGYEFKFCEKPIEFYSNGKFQTLEQAYNSGLLSDESLARLYDYNQRIYQYESIKNYRNNKASMLKSVYRDLLQSDCEYALDLVEYEYLQGKKEIELAISESEIDIEYEKALEKINALTLDNNAITSIKTIFSNGENEKHNANLTVKNLRITNYLGKYGDYYAVTFNYNDPTFVGYKKLYLGNFTFKVTRYAVYIIGEGKYYSLEEAYNLNLFSNEQLTLLRKYNELIFG